MIEVSVFGVWVATLASAVQVALVVVALGSVAFMAFTVIGALEPPRGARRTQVLVAAVGLAALVLALGGLRMGSAFATALVSAAGAAAVGGVAGCLRIAGGRAVLAVAGARSRRLARLQAKEKELEGLREAARVRFLEGGDLRDEVAGAETALARLRGALQALSWVRGELGVKLAESQGREGSPEVEEYARLKDEVELKISLGERVLEAAEAAAFRLSCFEPLRRLLRRRPHEATLGLSSAATAAELAGRLDAGTRAIEGFLGEVEGARASLDGLSAPRAGVAEGDRDPRGRARAEMDAMEAAYRAVLERAHVVRLRLAARQGVEEVASAAGSLSESARSLGAGLDEGDLQRLVEEVARAESAMGITAPDGSDVRALTNALARSVEALDRNDAASLETLVDAMREMR